MSVERDQITGLVLAGGRGSRMGGVDKGLQSHLGMPLAMHAMLRLAPQVGSLMISANRNLAAYESMGAPVWPDISADYAGPLTGWLTGLEHCATPYMVTVPCDAPHFPNDLVGRLAERLTATGCEIAMAATREVDAIRAQPMFCLMNAGLLESLAAFLRTGHSDIVDWTSRHCCAETVFDDGRAFIDVNTLTELHRLQLT